MPASLSAGTLYSRVQDDCEGIKDYSESLSVLIARDSDVWVNAGGHTPIRFRMSFWGGGMSHRVRNGLLVLAEAIRRDNLSSPSLQTQSVDEDSRHLRTTIKLVVSSNDEFERSIVVDTGLLPSDLPDQGTKDRILSDFRSFYSGVWKCNSVTAEFSSTI